MDPSPFASDKCKWIWTPNYDDATLQGRFVLFRKTFSLPAAHAQPPPPTTAEAPAPENHPKCLLHVSADTRYRLYLNGASISFGPAKSFLAQWYYDSVDIAPLLRRRPGDVNVLAARVLRFSSAHDGCLSMMRSPLPGLIVSCELGDVNIGTDLKWKTAVDDATALVPDDAWDYRLGPPFLRLNENVDGRRLPHGWLTAHFDDAAWPDAVHATPQRKMSPVVDPWRLVPRNIPVLLETPCTFDGVVTCSDLSAADSWRRLLSGDGTTVVIPGGSTQWVEFESSALTTGFIDLKLTCDDDDGDDDGAAATSTTKVTILYSECYESSMEDGAPRTKGDRADFRNGRLYGMADTYLAHRGANHYSPFWLRTFRYVRLTVAAPTAAACTLTALTYRATHYPLTVRTTITTADADAQTRQLWDTSVRTLRNCMHETYEDCPFYEQNQFAMDTRSMALFTYALARDDRLARKAMHEFYASRRADGLVAAHFPCPGAAHNIPTFSLFWVLMVWDHMVHFGDSALVRAYLGAVDDVLNYFDQRIDAASGLVGCFDHDCWGFVDWADGWFTPGVGFFGLAVPPAYYNTGSATFHTLLYAYAMAMASELCTFVGRNDTAQEYLDRRDTLLHAVKTHCLDQTTGFILDGPGATGQVSQHCQVFAVLAGCVTGEAAKSLLKRTILQREAFGLTKASFAMGFYMFRAASQADVYEDCWATLIQPWQAMLAKNMTTWAESESMVRSDCHGWSATPLWEIATEILGVDSRSEAYLERVVKRRDPAGRAEPAPIRVAARTALVRGQIAGNVLVGPGPDDHVRVELSRDTEGGSVSGQAARRTCVQREGSWALRQLD